MKPDAFESYRGKRAVLATMHAKERVIAPILREGMGLLVETVPKFDTDRFGTFSREIERTGSQLDAARAKIAAAFERVPEIDLAIASEGSFGPHPFIPLLPLGREIVLLTDRKTGLEIIGLDASPHVTFDHAVVSSQEAANAFAARIGFPEHGLIMMGCIGDKPSTSIALIKNIRSSRELERSVEHVIGLCGLAFLQTDMRAHRNPTRMTAIERATKNLVHRFHNRCPECGYPGYDIAERVSGLPCARCGLPTQVIQYDVSKCTKCGYSVRQLATTNTSADPGHCANCNP